MPLFSGSSGSHNMNTTFPSSTTSSRSSLTYTTPHESSQPPHPLSYSESSGYPGGVTPSHRRHSAYDPSHPHPYHNSSPISQSTKPRPRTRSLSTPTRPQPDTGNAQQTQTTRPHPRWFYGPAHCSGSPIQPKTPLEREISRGEQQMEMYGGDAVREPLPKTPSLNSSRSGSRLRSGSFTRGFGLGRRRTEGVPSPVPSSYHEEQRAEAEAQAEMQARIEEGGTPVAGHAFVSPSATLDANLVGWDGPDDPRNPQNWSLKYKWFITLICIIMTVNVTFASSAPSAATTGIIQEFGISREVSYLVTTMFLIGYVLGPLFWGPGSELIGRRSIFMVTMTLYTVFHLGQTLARNIQTLLITRFLSGFFAVAPLTNCGGVIADIWPAVGRGPATSLFTASVFLGPVLGPIIAGFIIEDGISWRWVFWVMMFFAAGCTLITVPFLPETYAPVILLKKVKRLRKADPIGNKNLYAEHEKQDWSIRGILNRTLLRPFKMLAMEPILVLITIYLSIVYGLLYALFQAFPIIFIQRHGFTISQDGLMFIGVGIGTTIGSLINFWTSMNYPQLIVKWRGFPPAENRLTGAMIGSPALVVGIFWMGWTGEYSSIPWYVPGLSTIVVGIGISLIFMSFLSYLVDTYLMYSASAFAANTVCRSAVAAAFPLFTVQMFDALGVNWACTLIGLVGVVFMPSPFLFYKYGARIREKSRFAPCIDLKIKKELEEEERKEKVKMAETKV